MLTRKEYTLKSVHKFLFHSNIKPITMEPKETLTPDQKNTWSTVLKFAVELIKLIIASFLGGTTSTLLS